MKLKRLLQTLILNTKKTSADRARYLKGIFNMVGENVAYQPRLIPLYPELIKLHNNIVIASGVTFVTHDAIHNMLNHLSTESRGGIVFPEIIGCIEVMDNVFIGANTNILYNVRIGENVIVGANSLVNKDLEANSVYAGVPAKKICDFKDFIIKRKNLVKATVVCNQCIRKDEVDRAWDYFYSNHSLS